MESMCRPYLLIIHLISVYLCIYMCTDPTSASGQSSSPGANVVEDERYKSGKDQYEAIRVQAKMPKYSACWLSALDAVEHGCKVLTDEIQHRLALGFANCFLQRSGRQTYPCDHSEDIGKCTGKMTPEAYNTYTEFFTHTQNICFFLQSQIWQEETERTVHRLAENSEHVAQQIEDSSYIQIEIMKKQNDSLINQEHLLERGNELKKSLEDSAVDVHEMLRDFKEATAEQKMSIMEVFDRIQSLQSLVLGEFTGFYSMIFYTTSLIVSYLLTSTPRTHGARFWLFFIMTLNVVLERLIVSYGANDSIDVSGIQINSSSIVYRRLNICRKVSCLTSFTVGWLKALFYFDINKVNNELLQTITEQNQQIKQLLQTSSHISVAGGDTFRSTFREEVGLDLTHKDEIDSNSPVEGYETGVESDCESDCSIRTDATDHTYKPDDFDKMSTCSSVSTFSTVSGRYSRSGTPDLLEELRDLQRSTPIRDIRKFLAESNGTDSSPSGTPKRRGRPPGSKNKIWTADKDYQLRDRSATPTSHHPNVSEESPDAFGRVVKHMAQVSQRNSIKTKHTLAKLRRSENYKFFSSDED